jgi:hypothetical protein
VGPPGDLGGAGVEGAGENEVCWPGGVGGDGGRRHGHEGMFMPWSSRTVKSLACRARLPFTVVARMVMVARICSIGNRVSGGGSIWGPTAVTVPLPVPGKVA